MLKARYFRCRAEWVVNLRGWTLDLAVLLGKYADKYVNAYTKEIERLEKISYTDARKEGNKFLLWAWRRKHGSK